MVSRIKKLLVIQNRIFLHSSGGYEIQIFNICKGLTRKGWQISHLAEANEPGTLTQDGFIIRLIQPRYYYSGHSNVCTYLIHRIPDVLSMKVVMDRIRLFLTAV